MVTCFSLEKRNLGNTPITQRGCHWYVTGGCGIRDLVLPDVHAPQAAEVARANVTTDSEPRRSDNTHPAGGQWEGLTLPT